jgi:hypothetical protein
MNAEIRALVRKLEATTITTLEPVADKSFRNETVDIDGKRFTSCTFKGCSLNYSGGNVEFGPGCLVENSRPIFSGAARHTVLLLHSLGLLSFNPFNEERRKANGGDTYGCRARPTAIR